MAQDGPESGMIAANPGEARPYQRGQRRRDGGRGSSVLLSTLLVVLLVGFVLGGWFLVTQHEELRTARVALDDAGRRINALEDRLRLTDESLSASEEGTNEQLTFWESEIRKLWDIGNKRNRTWIQDNQAALARLEKSLAAALTDLGQMKSNVSRHESAFDQQQDIADRLTAIDLQLNRLVSGNRDLVDKANSAAQIAARLERRVSENEEAVRAIDNWRGNANSRIADLESGRRSRPATPPAGPDISL